MGFNSASGFTTPQSVNVTGGVTLQKNSVQTISGALIANATTTLGTVTAGKTWRIIQIEMTQFCGAGQLASSIKLNDVAILNMVINGTLTSYSNQTVAFKGSYADALVLPQNQTIKSTCPALAVGSYNIYYVEE